MIPENQSWARCLRHDAPAEYTAILTALYRLAGEGPAVDLGCGEAHVTRDWGMATLVDLVKRPSLNRFVHEWDILQAPSKFQDNKQKFNLMVMTDVIEHLLCCDAIDLLKGMEPLCKAMAIFTPVGPWRLNERATHPDAHKSAWCPEQFWAVGWEILECPAYHRFEGGEILGAFWAWKWADGNTPTAEEVMNKAGITL